MTSASSSVSQPVFIFQSAGVQEIILTGTEQRSATFHFHIAELPVPIRLRWAERRHKNSRVQYSFPSSDSIPFNEDSSSSSTYTDNC